MHHFINLCACCLESDISLSEYPIKNERNYTGPNKCIQQIQTIYTNLQLNNSVPFQLCNGCQRLLYEAIQIKQYLDYQDTNEQSQKLLLKENTCSGCLEIYTRFFDQVYFANDLEFGKKNCIDMIKEALPQIKFDSNKSYKYCHCCSNCIKSLYLLKELITRNNTLYEKYCSTMFNTTDFQNLKISRLLISLQKTAIQHINSNFEEVVIKEEISIHDSIDIKIENDECDYNFLTSMPNNYPFLEEPHKKEDNICHQDDCNPESIGNESDYFQVPISSKTTLNTNNQIFSLSDHDQIEIDVKPHNIYSGKSCNAEIFLNEGKHLDSAEGHLKEDKNMDTKKPYKCKYCTKSFTRTDHLTSHEGVHTGDRPYKCKYCVKSFTQSDDLKAHEIIHTAEKPFKCNYCTKSFNRKTNLIVHERVHTGEKPYKCNHCTKAFKTSTHLIVHERIHTGEKPYKCNYCSKSFVASNDVKKHEKIHTGEKPFKCNVCEKLFADRHQLKNHEIIHTDEKPFRCNYCTKSFNQRNNLTLHERTHTGEKPYKCNYCKESFTTRPNLIVHERNHTGETPYKCNHCSKYFNTKESLGNHERIHSGEKPYKCSKCSKSFTARSSLVVHERTHTGEAPYKCNYCTKSFNQKNNLVVHKRIHTGESPFNCEYCSKSFSSKFYLSKHKNIHSGE